MRSFFGQFPGNDALKNKNASECACVFPYVNGKNYSKPWFNKGCAEAVRGKNKAFNEWLSCRTDSKRIAFSKSRNQCNKIIDETKKSLDEKWADRLSACPANKKQFWYHSKKLSTNSFKSAFPPLNLSDGSIAVIISKNNPPGHENL